MINARLFNHGAGRFPKSEGVVTVIVSNDNTQENPNGDGSLPPTRGGSGAKRPLPQVVTNAIAERRNAEAIAKVILGQNGVEAAWLQKALPALYCQEVAERFTSETLAHARQDGVPGRELGATQYGKTPNQYLDASYLLAGSIEHLLGGVNNPIRSQLRALADVLLKQGHIMRPAVWRGEATSTARIVNWSSDGSGEYLLKLHDDLAQTRSKQNNGFEVQRVRRIIAINIYLNSTPGSGQLEVWNWRPNPDERRRLGVENTGYPVDRNSVPSGYKSTLFSLSTGDIVCIDGSLLHGVIVGEGRVSQRLLMNMFLGLLPDGDVIFWA